MPRFSVVVATLDRTEELARLLGTIRDQQRQDVEIILVDQNEDDRLIPIVKSLGVEQLLHHLKFSQKNVSAARNAGLDATTGEIVAFPDDDCWYPANLLNEVDAWFRANDEYAVLAVGALDDKGHSSGNRWIQDACDIKSWNCLRTTFCSSLFISAVARSREVRFDHALTRGEETDFILRLLATGLRGRFDRTLQIVHPRRDMMSGTVSIERATSYGAGMGRLVRRHSLVGLWASLLVYDLARAFYVSLRGKSGDAAFCFAHAKGLFQGFVLQGITHE
jgi:glycosyltransferase involved in cell wall biosynthesis